ncbi:EexN family lipoprotein [Bartonella sp. WD12.1]|uniref:EexN family lipoprotein n=1 Tax=Bartonella sp. WD12.1 TaxID=1933903 RepID=UPI0009C9037B|nr:EexN family lipoprotein [Bartonella sp. WD12.1]OPB28409.1 hypothetical protein BWD121_016770 [Bartonella sp. WD12.1]
MMILTINKEKHKENLIMKKIIMTILLLCTVLVITGCEKIYSAEEFKKNKELRSEWAFKCMTGESSKNCETVQEAINEIEIENRKKRMEEFKKKLEDDRKKAKEEYQKQLEEYNKKKEEREKTQQKKEPHNE